MPGEMRADLPSAVALVPAGAAAFAQPRLPKWRSKGLPGLLAGLCKGRQRAVVLCKPERVFGGMGTVK